jgi:Transcription factor WhiB
VRWCGGSRWAQDTPPRSRYWNRPGSRRWSARVAAHWRADASCRGLDPDLFHGRLDQMRQAQRVCARCPVAEICLWTALLLEDPLYRNGVFGGLLPGQRRQLAELCDSRQAAELLEPELAWFANGSRLAAS